MEMKMESDVLVKEPGTGEICVGRNLPHEQALAVYEALYTLGYRAIRFAAPENRALGQKES